MTKPLILIAFLSTRVYACDANIEDLVQSEFGTSYSHLVCKRNPVSDQETIVAFAGNTVNQQNGTTINDATTLIINNNKITNRITEKSILVSDAIYLDDIKVDTAAYTISDDIRAFGIRFVFRGSSRVNPYTEEFINLYIKDHTKLNNVLSGLTTYEHSGEWDGMLCNGDFDISNYYLSVLPTKTHSFSDILVTKKSEHEHTSESKIDCNSEVTKSPVKKYQILFDGTKYSVPKNLRSSLLNSKI